MRPSRSKSRPLWARDLEQAVINLWVTARTHHLTHSAIPSAARIRHSATISQHTGDSRGRSRAGPAGRLYALTPRTRRPRTFAAVRPCGPHNPAHGLVTTMLPIYTPWDIVPRLLPIYPADTNCQC